jgi:hypothetical protein
MIMAYVFTAHVFTIEFQLLSKASLIKGSVLEKEGTLVSQLHLAVRGQDLACRNNLSFHGELL